MAFMQANANLRNRRRTAYKQRWEHRLTRNEARKLVENGHVPV